jgi:hypothetical protein
VTAASPLTSHMLMELASLIYSTLTLQGEIINSDYSSENKIMVISCTLKKLWQIILEQKLHRHLKNISTGLCQEESLNASAEGLIMPLHFA